MSKVKIQGNASGTGVVTLTAPNTNTDRTITLPDETVSLTGAPAGLDDVGGVARATSGLLFNADTAAANALDDYEEGTWTPNTSSGAWTIGSATYTKVGQLVTCCFDVQASATISAVDFGGLPFTPTNNSAGVVGYQNSEGGATFAILVQSAGSWNFRVGSTQKGLVNTAYARGVFSYITA